MNIVSLDSYRTNPNVQKMLATLQAAEGVKHGYNTSFGNTRFDSLADHPRESKPFKNTRGETQYTTAAGAYQFLSRTWDDFRNSVEGVSDFGADNQDRGAVWLMQRAGALEDVAAGNWEAALPKLAPVWASLPNSPYPQKTRSKDFIYKMLTGAEQQGSSVAQPGTEPVAPEVEVDPDYPRLPTARGTRGGKDNSVAEALLEGAAAETQRTSGTSQGDAMATAQWEGMVREQSLRDSTTLGNLWDAYQTDPRVMSQLALMDQLTKEKEVVPEGWTYMANREEIEKPWIHNPDAIEYLRENVRGPESMRAAHAQLLYRQDLDTQYGRRGGLANFAMGAASSMTDVPAFVASLGVAKAFQVAKIGHAALAARGRPVAATSAFLGEAAVGNVAVEGLLDYLGEVKTAGDYGFAALTGAAFAAPFAKGAYVDGLNAHIHSKTEEFNHSYVADQAAKVEQVRQDNPSLTPEQVVAKVEQREVEAINRANNDALSSTFNTKVIPDEVGAAMKAEDVEVEVPQSVAGAEEPASQTQLADSAPVVEGPAQTTTSTPDTEPVAKTQAELGDSFPVSEAVTITPEGTSTRELTYSDGSKAQQVLAEDAKGATQWMDASTALPDGWAPHKDIPGAGKAGKYTRAVNAKELLEQVANGTYRGENTTDSSQASRTAAQQLLNTLPEEAIAKLESTPVVWKGTDYRSNYSVYTDGSGQLNMGSRSEPWVVIHELAHTVTEEAIAKLLAKGIDGVPAHQRAGVQRLNDIFQSLKDAYSGDDSRVAYGLINLHEFAAQALSDPRFQAWLNTQQVGTSGGGVSSAWREFVRAVANLIGIKAKPGYALSESLEALGSILQVSKDAPTPTMEPTALAKWMGDSPMVNEDGSPKVWYHGTPDSTIEEFRPSVAGATFLTENPHFANDYTSGANSNRVTEDVRPTVMPLMTNVKNPFDFQIDAHVDALVDHVLSKSEVKDGSGNSVLPDEFDSSAPTMYDRDTLVSAMKGEDNWGLLEREDVQASIRELGHDAFYVSESGNVNLGVYNPSAIKSIFNDSPTDSPNILQAPPNVRAAAERKWIARILDNAKAVMDASPIDRRRLDVLLNRFGATKDLVSDGLRMAGSNSKLMQLLSRTVVETTTGAAGRNNTAAIVLPQLQRAIMGNFLPEVQGHFNVWANQQGYGTLARNLKAGPTQEFNRLVFEEIHSQRATRGVPVSSDKSVVAAAESVLRMAERDRAMKVREQVAGSEHLPQDSIGYLPQALDGAKLSQAATENPAALDALRRVLSSQFQSTYGWPKDFSDDLAMNYTIRQMARTKGNSQFDSLGAGGDSLAVVRDVVEEMANGNGQFANLADLALRRDLGMSSVKQRLDVNMLEELGVDGLRVMDFYEQDFKKLMRTTAHRTAGVVALTRHGIPGLQGVTILERALIADPATTPADMEVFRRVMAGILGTQYAGRVISQGAANLGGLVNLQRMGSLVFNQMTEPVTMLFQMGIRSFLSGLASLPRHFMDVRKMVEGKSVDGVLRSIETYGGADIGLDGYRMVAPLDPTDAQINAYADNAGTLTRLIRAGGHLQSKVTFFRRLIGAQHRMVAEQIMLKAIRYSRDASPANDKYLADMGFTPELMAIMRAELPGIAKWDSRGNLVDFDLTKLSDPGAAQAFINSVHRGTSQIIQDTFVGEQNAWVHNDYLRLLTQFRSYSLTAMEKQWGRTRMNSGFFGAAGMLMGQAVAGAIMHTARVYSMSLGREDREEYIERAMHPVAMTTSAMNYASLSGLLSDGLQAATFLTGWDEDLQEMTGARSGQGGFSSIVPFAGSIDQAARVVGGKADVYTALKQLPGSNIWYLVPLMNLTKE